jgi:tetratricopeptide (TPR) repeat protein
VSAIGSETDLPIIQEQNLLPYSFLSKLEAARDQSTNPIIKLEALYKTLTTPAEQAEMELTIARISTDRTGFVNFARALEWYDKALVRPGLPPTALAKQFILRGNCHEVLKQPEDALADYVRGLLVCLQFNLPKQWPSLDGKGKLPLPSLNDGVDFNGQPSPAKVQANHQIYSDFMREDRMNRQEQDLLMQKYYYVEAIKRVLGQEKWTEQNLRGIAEKLTNREDRLDELLRLAREPNPRPWP